jgi:hypothetical protein
MEIVVVKSLRQGNPVALLGSGHDYGNSSGHYLLATGIDKNGNVNILDPKNRNNNRKHSLSSLASSTYKAITMSRSGGRGGTALDLLQSFMSAGGASISSPYGDPTDRSGPHRGIDIAPLHSKLPVDVPAFLPGKIVQLNSTDASYKGWGYMIAIEDAKKNTNIYCHFGIVSSGLYVGKDIKQGEILGQITSITTGNSSGPHLHFEIREGGMGGTSNFNPESYLGGFSSSAEYKKSSSTTPSKVESSGDSTTGNILTRLGSVLSSGLSNAGAPYNAMTTALSNAANWTNSKSSGSKSSNKTNVSGSAPAPGKTGRVITLPSDKKYGASPTYMGWQMITSQSSNQYKLRSDAGQNFDNNGFGKIGNRYVIATTSTFGNVGDYVKVKYADGSELDAIIGDIKNQGDNGANKWGHNNGESAVEFVVDKDSWYGKKDNSYLPHAGTDITSIANEGNYWGTGGRGQQLLSMKTNAYTKQVLQEYSGGRGSSGSPIKFKYKTNYKNTPGVNIARGSSPSYDEKPSTNNNMSTQYTGGQGNDRIVTVLETIVELLASIKDSNSVIASKPAAIISGSNSDGNTLLNSMNSKQQVLNTVLSGV